MTDSTLTMLALSQGNGPLAQLIKNEVKLYGEFVRGLNAMNQHDYAFVSRRAPMQGPLPSMIKSARRARWVQARANR
jgi:hypothetical protein